MLALEAGAAPAFVRFLPNFVGTQRERRMLSLHHSVHEWLFHPVNDDGLIQLKAAVKVHFSDFVIGAEIDDLDYMKRVSNRSLGYDDFSDEIWSIRPWFKPKQRFFGTFFREDWFVVFTKRTRDYLDDDDDRWDAEVETVVEAWDNLFYPRPRHSGDTFGGYVTANSEHCDDRW
jgi:hypothetical protein